MVDKPRRPEPRKEFGEASADKGPRPPLPSAYTRTPPPSRDSMKESPPVPLHSTEELNAIETACAVLDQEVERIARIVGARETLQSVTAQVKILLASLQPLQAQHDVVKRELVDLEEERKAQRVAFGKTLQESQETMTKTREEAQAQMAHLAAEHQEWIDKVASARQAACAEQKTLEEKTDALQGSYAAKREAAEREHDTQVKQLEEQLQAIESQVKVATELRDRLTALRG